MSKQDVTDLDIQALIDGELDAQRAAEVRMFIEKSGVVQKRYTALCEQKQLLHLWWAQHKKS